MYQMVQSRVMTTQAPDHAARQRLLDKTIDYVSEHGIGDLSLRRLATAIGTSHRMLIYHFGSKDGLMREVVRSVEQQQRDALADLDLDPTIAEVEMMRRMWQRLSEPSMWPKERLFYELYGNALGGRGSEFLDDVIESWVAPVAAQLARRRGYTAAEARAEARLRLAVVRGLLLDLVASRDRAGVNQAHERFVAMCELAREETP
jgi:AcrR family transcriptional regulator